MPRADGLNVSSNILSVGGILVKSFFLIIFKSVNTIRKCSIDHGILFQKYSSSLLYTIPLYNVLYLITIYELYLIKEHLRL
jgi:hypothetical protein